jgi:hypothetical protein
MIPQGPYWRHGRNSIARSPLALQAGGPFFTFEKIDLVEAMGREEIRIFLKTSARSKAHLKASYNDEA